jgi:AcrR family transcriptional regulator
VTDQRSPTYAHLLDLAEGLFNEMGYDGVSLRDLARELGIKHASLYHHVPGGKQQLYIAVMERTLHRHRVGIETAIRETQGSIVDKMRAVAAWILGQPPFDEHRMRTQDLPHLPPEQQQALSFLAFRSFQQPVRDVLLIARQQGEIDLHNIDLAAVMFLRGIQALHDVPFEYTTTSKEAVAEDVIQLLLNGWRPR